MTLGELKSGTNWLGVAADLLGLGVVLQYVRRFPTDLTWNQVFVWALAAVIGGGLFWAFVFTVGKRSGFFIRMEDPTGGTGSEPSGAESTIWVLTNLAGPLGVAWWVNAHLPNRPAYPGAAYLACIGGLFLGAVIFYGLDVRSKILDRVEGYSNQEFLLVLIWSALIVGLGFAAFDATAARVAGSRVPSSVVSWLVRTGVCVTVTTLSVTAYVVFDPRRAKSTEAVRGFIAALALILSVFFASIITSFTEVRMLVE